MSGTTRGGILKRALVAAGGLVGLGAAGEAASAAAPRRLVLYAPRGPLAGEHRPGRAFLRDAPDGRRVGELYVVALGLRTPGALEPALVEALEQHTFKLSDGAIFGNGTVDAGAGAFAILGGTGRYAGARGTYELRIHEDTAEFVFTLL